MAFAIDWFDISELGAGLEPGEVEFIGFEFEAPEFAPESLGFDLQATVKSMTAASGTRAKQVIRFIKNSPATNFASKDTTEMEGGAGFLRRVVAQSDSFQSRFGVILSAAVFQAERRISHSPFLWEIPHAAEVRRVSG